MKVAVIFASGMEESEGLTIVDIIRRANITCDIVGLEELVTGAHQVVMKADRVLDTDVTSYDMIVLPGGYGGVDRMYESDTLLQVLKTMNEEGKYIAAMCAAPVVLEKAGLLENKNYTAYVGYDKKINAGTYTGEKVVIDGNIITGKGPAFAYAFAYKLVDVLGGDSLAVKNRMVYFNAFDVMEDE